MKTLRCFFLLIALVTLPASHVLHDQEIARTEITILFRDMLKAWNSNDILGTVAGYLNSEETLMVRDGEVVRGWQAIYHYFEAAYAGNVELGEIELTNFKIELVNSTTGIVSYEFVVIGDPSVGGTRYGASTLIVVRSGNYWRVKHSHASSRPQP